MAHLKLSQDLRPVSEQQAIQRDLQEAVDEAEHDLTQGNWVDHSDIETKLKRWSAKLNPHPLTP